MRPSSMIFVLLFASASLAAHAQADASHLLFVRPPASQACPVALSATREPSGPLHSVESTPTPRGQGLQINFAGSTNLAIVKADILVHGVSTPGREGMILTGPAPGSGYSSVKTGRYSTESIQVVGTAGEPVLHPLVWTKSMSAINWLELTRLEYADGTVWQASADSRCVAAPSLFVPVAH